MCRCIGIVEGECECVTVGVVKGDGECVTVMGY